MQISALANIFRLRVSALFCYVYVRTINLLLILSSTSPVVRQSSVYQRGLTELRCPLHPSTCNIDMSSKISVSSVRGSIKDLLDEANNGEKRRNFVETIELQIGLKNYDPQRDKRFSGTVKCVAIFCQNSAIHLTKSTYNDRLPNIPRPRLSLCILADAADVDRAKQIELEYMTADDLKKCVLSFRTNADSGIYCSAQAQ